MSTVYVALFLERGRVEEVLENDWGGTGTSVDHGKSSKTSKATSVNLSTVS